ncbi:MAG: glycosyltransferase family 2 protein [Coriobacteriia bacterium]|nr:glycosyltransferase family 2 protein [Coriobacteriia bacterium]
MSAGGETAAATPPRVEVVIVAHNAGELLGDAVRSAAEQAGAANVWVMDAESSDGSVQREASQAQGVHFVAVPNRGFSASNNRGIEATRSPFVLLLNPDARLEPGALEALLASAEAHLKAGAIGPAILNPDGSAQANSFGRFPTLATTIALRFQRLAENLSGNSTHSPRLPAATTPVDWVTGAAMLVRRSAIEDAGKMDERFFLYYEDTEWCHRMRDHAWEVLLEPAARVTHHLGGSGAPQGRAAAAYRDSFYRYCDLYGLWGLKAFASVGLSVRKVFGGAG